MDNNINKIEQLERLISNNSSKIVENINNYSKDKSIKLIDFDNNDIQYHENNLNDVISLVPNEMPISIISIVGAFRTGKSFILNFILRFLSDNSNKKLDNIDVNEWINNVSIIPGNKKNKKNGFKWCNGTESQTMGIWIWEKPIIFNHPTKGNIAIILLDTQGLFDLNTNQKKTIMLFGISALISSHIIFNVDKRIQEDNLQHLALFSAYGQLVNNRHYKNNAGLQTLDFLVRDWQNFDEIKEVNQYSESYIKKIFSNRKYDDMNNTRNQIKNCFSQIRCFFLPHPGLNAISSDYIGDTKALNNKFLLYVKEYMKRTFITNPIETKLIGNTDISSKEISHILKSYIEVFKKQEGFPEAKTILDSTIKIQHNIAIEKAYAIFIKNADKICHLNSSYLIEEKFNNLIQKNKLLALHKFNIMATLGDNITKNEHKLLLEQKLDQSINKYTELNKSHKPFQIIGAYMIPIVAIILSVIMEKMFFACSTTFVICNELYMISTFMYYLTIIAMIAFTIMKYLVPIIQFNKL